MDKNPLPMQYLGSKSRIAGWIIEEIQRGLPSATAFLDIFSGSGVMALAAGAAGYRVGANDIQQYSYTILNSLLALPRDALPELTSRVEALPAGALLKSGREGAAEHLEREDDFFAGGRRDWRSYRKFCRETPVIAGTRRETGELREAGAWNLFWRYYANNYFGVRQCLELDALAEVGAGLPENQRQHLTAAILSVMTFFVSSTTHLAQYLKPSSKGNASNLMTRRRKSFLPEVARRLRALERYPLAGKGALVTREDYQDALEKAPLNENWVVYVDPPYFKEHYSRYYHVLDTFAHYDYPDLTYNKRLGKVTVGRYREHRYVSQFGLRARVGEAFARLFRLTRSTGACIALSYANTSLVQREQLIELANEAGYEVTEKTRKLMHSGQGQPRNKNVVEYLFMMQ